VRAGIALAVIVGAAGCAATTAALVQRAMVELHCPVERMEVATVNDWTAAVRGCGKQATYAEICSPSCSWKMQGTPVPIPDGGVSDDR
jgi:hypothetical protein